MVPQKRIPFNNRIILLIFMAAFLFLNSSNLSFAVILHEGSVIQQGNSSRLSQGSAPQQLSYAPNQIVVRVRETLTKSLHYLVRNKKSIKEALIDKNSALPDLIKKWKVTKADHIFFTPMEQENLIKEGVVRYTQKLWIE